MNYRNIFITLAALSGTVTASAWSAESATVAFLMPDQASTRYEQHDFPGFKAEMSKLCADCKVIYQNANANASLQQQQFNSVIAQGAKVIVLDPVTLPPPPRWSKTPKRRGSRSLPMIARYQTNRLISTSHLITRALATPSHNLLPTI